jgi:hypothetical protein
LVTVKGAWCSRGRRKERPGTPIHDRHAGDGERGSATVRPERGKVEPGVAGCTRCTVRRRERMEMVHYGPRPIDHDC